MREYKFRGISKETNEFVYGDPITDPKTNTISCILEYEGIPRKFIEIMPETLGQLIGLKIYEGDIITFDGITSYGDVMIEKVIYSEERLRYEYTSYDGISDPFLFIVNANTESYRKHSPKP
jgi:hypothetical protein